MVNFIFESQIKEVEERLPDADSSDIKKTLYKLVKEGKLIHSGGKTYRRYRLNEVDGKKNRK